MATKTISPREELAGRFIRLFIAAGLLTMDQVESYTARHKRNKPILEVLQQEVSLTSFRDLLTAELTFRRVNRVNVNVTAGLTAAGLVTDDELRQLLMVHRPPLDRLIQELREDAVIDEERARRLLELKGAEGAYERLIGEDAVNAPAVCQWLSRLDSRIMREVALAIALHVFRHNELVNKKKSDALRVELGQGKLDEVTVAIRDELGLDSDRLQEKIAEGLRLPQFSGELDPALRGLLPQSLIRRHLILPCYQDEHSVGIASSDPLNIPLAALIHWVSGRWPQPAFAPARQVIDQINALDGKSAPEGAAGVAVDGQAAPQGKAGTAARRFDADILVDNTSAVQLVGSLIESAIELRTTDIHLEPARDGLVVRFRIDGDLHRISTIPPGLAQPVISRIKVLADMDVTERRRPQDGHFELNVDSNTFDFRISTLPAILGEKVVIRILDGARLMTGMDDLGLLPQQRERFDWMLDRPHGLILVTGPTGSGKTSTLYTGLQHINTENRNLVTIEDPVEYQLAGINQVQVDPHIGLDFSSGLRSILRQDPDVILVGESRDGDTARSALRAAMTGHLVLSTLHTNTALGSIDTLIQLGVQPFTLGNSLCGIVSQRLVRRLCAACRQEGRLTDVQALELGLGDDDLNAAVYTAGGCDGCLGSGYYGRTGVFEVIQATEALRPLVAAHRPQSELEAKARELGMLSLAQAGGRKVLAGETSYEEIARRILIDA